MQLLLLAFSITHFELTYKHNALCMWLAIIKLIYCQVDEIIDLSTTPCFLPEHLMSLQPLTSWTYAFSWFSHKVLAKRIVQVRHWHICISPPKQCTSPDKWPFSGCAYQVVGLMIMPSLYSLDYIYKKYTVSPHGESTLNYSDFMTFEYLTMLIIN